MKLMKIFSAIKSFFVIDKKIYLKNQDLIMDNNRKMLIRASFTYLIILFLYTFFTFIHNEPRSLMVMYICFDTFHIFLSAFVVVFSIRKKLSNVVTRVLVYLLELSLLSFFALEGIFAYPTSHSLYVPIAIFLIVVVFNHQLNYLLLLSFIYICFFVMGAFLVKPYDVAIKDLEIGIATLLASMISSFFLAHLHHNLARWVNKYEELCKIDQFTGLYNKVAIVNLASEFIHKHENQEQNYVLAIMDLDNFKVINDSLGHQIGDQALTKFSKELKASFSSSSLIGRYGGDEFIVVKDVICKEEFENQLTDFLSRVRKISVPGVKFNLSCSIGFVITKGSKMTLEELLGKADKFLYVSKNNGKAKWKSEE